MLLVFLVTAVDHPVCSDYMILIYIYLPANAYKIMVNFTCQLKVDKAMMYVKKNRHVLITNILFNLNNFILIQQVKLYSLL